MLKNFEILRVEVNDDEDPAYSAIYFKNSVLLFDKLSSISFNEIPWFNVSLFLNQRGMNLKVLHIHDYSQVFDEYIIRLLSTTCPNLVVLMIPSLRISEEFWNKLAIDIKQGQNELLLPNIRFLKVSSRCHTLRESILFLFSLPALQFLEINTFMDLTTNSLNELSQLNFCTNAKYLSVYYSSNLALKILHFVKIFSKLEKLDVFRSLHLKKSMFDVIKKMNLNLSVTNSCITEEKIQNDAYINSHFEKPVKDALEYFQWQCWHEIVRNSPSTLSK